MLALISQEKLQLRTKKMKATASLGSRSKETEGRVGDRLVQGDLLDAHLKQLSCIGRRTEDNTVIVDGARVVLDLVLLLL